MKITVHWQIEDGYVGGSRPQETVIRPYEDLGQEEWEEMTESEREEFIQQCVQEDFEQKITFAIERTDYSDGE